MTVSTQKNLCMLGATGSIGNSTLDIVRNHPQLFKIHSLVAQQNVSKILRLCLEFKPKFVVLEQESAAKQLQDQLMPYVQSHQLNIHVLSGAHAINEMAAHPEVDIVVAAIVGAYGLTSALAAAQASKTILLANKEALIMGGKLFMNAVKQHGARLLPIDSEHNALFQCLPKDEQGHCTYQGVKQLILTASGGPFRTKSINELHHVSLKEALKHPNWVMGAKVTLDSASLMNKGLELIEAHFLFDMPVERLQVLVHPQSIIHSLVHYEDGSFLAQLGEPDMRIPIAQALAYAHEKDFRIQSHAKTMDLTQIAQLTFEAADTQKFPCLRLAFEGLKLGGSALVTLNAANEIAVSALLKDQIQFMQVPNIIENCLSHFGTHTVYDLTELLEFDTEVRRYAQCALS